ncbi:MAG: diguanylate cyclase [Pseudomonadota bacterium]
MRSLLTLLRCLLFAPLLLHSTLLHATALESVSLQLQWKHQFENAGFYAAIEKGFYKDEGLRVELREIKSGINPLQEVLQGKANFGLSYSSLITDYLKGKPIVMLANIFKHSALVIIAQKELDLPSDLIGKKIMGSEFELKNSGITMMFNRFKMNINDVTVIESSHTIDAFVEKRIDAMTAFITNQPYLLNLKKIRYTIHNPTSYGSQFYDVNLFTSAQEVKKHPERTAAFRRASIKGWKYALSHSDEIIQLILEKYNSQNKSIGALRYEAEITKSLILPKIYGVGSIDCQILNEMAENFISQGMAPAGSDLKFRHFLLNKNCSAPQSNITFEEQQYLNNREDIKVCVDPNWMPFEQIKDGKYIGMSADYMRVIEKDLQTPIIMVPTQSWAESIEYAKLRKCDIFSLVMATPERKKYMNFTQPYLVVPLVIATTTDKFFIADLDEVLDKKLGIVKDYAFAELLKLQYPSINLVEVDTLDEGLKKVENKLLFGMIDNLTTIGYQMQKKYIGTLKIAGRIGKNWELGIGVRNDDLMLLDILEKAIHRIDEKTKQEILNQWMSITYEQPKDYSLLWKSFAVLGIVFILIFYRYRVGTKYNKDLKKLNQQLKKTSITDPLTKIYNRRFIDSSIQSAFDLAKRYQTPFSIILLDIDDFKQVNDAYGHVNGDIVLQKIAEILLLYSRKNDVVGRWGGEEFLILCSLSESEGAIKMAEKLRKKIVQEVFDFDLSITASFGITEYRSDDNNDTIITRVDKALYQAKNEGKNRFAFIK